MHLTACSSLLLLECGLLWIILMSISFNRSSLCFSRMIFRRHIVDLFCMSGVYTRFIMIELVLSLYIMFFFSGLIVTCTKILRCYFIIVPADMNGTRFFYTVPSWQRRYHPPSLVGISTYYCLVIRSYSCHSMLCKGRARRSLDIDLYALWQSIWPAVFERFCCARRNLDRLYSVLFSIGNSERL